MIDVRRLIDAYALIAEMHNVILEDGEDRRTFYEVIERQPTIEPERKKGKWIEYNATGKKQWMCSECCAEEKNPKVARFCYWCGADMRGEDDDIPIEYFESGGK